MGDQHDHGHHDQSHSRASSAFRWSIALNSVLTALQLVVGFAFGSLALIGDAPTTSAMWSAWGLAGGRIGAGGEGFNCPLCGGPWVPLAPWLTTDWTWGGP